MKIVMTNDFGEDYVDDLLLQRPGTQRSCCDTLARIVEQGRLIATSDGIRAATLLSVLLQRRLQNWTACGYSVRIVDDGISSPTVFVCGRCGCRNRVHDPYFTATMHFGTI